MEADSYRILGSVGLMERRVWAGPPKANKYVFRKAPVVPGKASGAAAQCVSDYGLIGAATVSLDARMVPPFNPLRKTGFLSVGKE